MRRLVRNPRESPPTTHRHHAGEAKSRVVGSANVIEFVYPAVNSYQLVVFFSCFWSGLFPDVDIIYTVTAHASRVVPWCFSLTLFSPFFALLLFVSSLREKWIKQRLRPMHSTRVVRTRVRRRSSVACTSSAPRPCASHGTFSVCFFNSKPRLSFH